MFPDRRGNSLATSWAEAWNKPSAHAPPVEGLRSHRAHHLEKVHKAPRDLGEGNDHCCTFSHFVRCFLTKTKAAMARTVDVRR